MSDTREERREEEYRHRHIDIDIQTRKNRERRFYVPQSFIVTMDRLDKILVREGKSLSRWIRDHAEPYVRMHEAGNPQTDIVTFTDPAKPSPMKVVCSRIRGAMSDGHVLCSLTDSQQSGSVWIQGFKCYGCKRNRVKKDGTV